MKKIIIALNNKTIYEKLNKNKLIEIVGRDILYEEGILEILEKNKEINYILINDNIIKNNLEELIKKIIEINKNIKIIYFLEKENNEKILLLKKYNIKNIFLNNNIDINYLINIFENNKKEKTNYNKKDFLKIKDKKIMNNKNLLKNLKIKLLIKKYLIKLKNNKLNKFNLKNNKIIRYLFNKFKKIKNKILNKNKITLNKKLIISVDGKNDSGKTIFSIIFSKFIEKENKKVLIIDCDKNLKEILGIKLKNFNEIIKYSKNIDIINYQNNKEYNFKYLKEIYDVIIIDFSNNLNYINKEKIIKNSDVNLILLEPNLINIIETRKIIEWYKNILNNCTYNIYIIKNKVNKFSIKNNTIKICFPEINILEKIKYRKKYTNLINNNFKYFFIDKKFKHYFFKKEYMKIIKKIINK